MKKEFIVVKLDPATVPEDGRHVSFFAFELEGVQRGIYVAREEFIYTSAEEFFDLRSEVLNWTYEEDPVIQKSIDMRVNPTLLAMLKLSLEEHRDGIKSAIDKFNKK